MTRTSLSAPPARSLFEQPLDAQVLTVAVEHIVPPEDGDINPAVEKPGVLQSVLLAPSADPRRPYRIVDGKRRVRSALKYGHTHVPAILTDGTPGQIAAASALLNAARDDNPLDEARNWQVALENYASPEALAHDLRVSVSTIKKRLKLLDLPGDLLAAVGSHLAIGVAERLANLDPEYRAQGVQAARRKLALGERFTAHDFKVSQTRRAEDLQGGLADLFGEPGAASAPALLPAPDPLRQAVLDVCRIAQLHGVAMPELLHALKHHDPVQASGPHALGEARCATRAGPPELQAPRGLEELFGAPLPAPATPVPAPFAPDEPQELRDRRIDAQLHPEEEPLVLDEADAGGPPEACPDLAGPDAPGTFSAEELRQAGPAAPGDSADFWADLPPLTPTPTPLARPATASRVPLGRRSA